MIIDSISARNMDKPMCPRMIINLDKIGKNARTVMSLCAGKKVAVTAVTKGVCGDVQICQALLQNGVHALGDTRIANLKRIAALPCEKWMIRLPMLSECADVVRYADISLVSEVSVLQRLNDEALRQGKFHGVLVMADMGDRREGCVDQEEIKTLIRLVESSPGLFLKGLGTNLGCYGFVQTDVPKMEQFSHLARELSSDLSLVYSAGNSSGLSWMLESEDLGLVNHFRLGESIIFGRERRDFTQIPGTADDAFVLEAEVIELKKKPSLPEGTIGRDSFGHTPKFANVGDHWRAVLAVGRQDIEPDGMAPCTPGLRILGASYDHMIVEVPPGELKVGDRLSFKMQYPSVVRAMTSEYVDKIYVTHQDLHNEVIHENSMAEFY